MRRILGAVTAASILVLAGCGGGDLATDSHGHSVVTAPAARAGTVVNQQNQQLRQMEQQTGQADPTSP